MFDMKKKKLFSILLTLVMVISMIPVTAFAGEMTYLDSTGTVKTAEAVTGITSGGSYNAGWYVLSGEQSLSQITFTGETHLILADGANITINGGIILSRKSASLTIYAQSTGDKMGKLTADSSSSKFEGQAGIGTAADGECGDITINGGVVTAKGGSNGAGIGTGKGSKSRFGNITINGGVVTANGGLNGAGIGSGKDGQFMYITINGGVVTAKGSSNGAGIGTGYGSTGVSITVNGGDIEANGGSDGAGIGTGYNGNCGGITINGGDIKAEGGEYAAGIGSGKKGWTRSIAINNGKVTATGGNEYDGKHAAICYGDPNNYGGVYFGSCEYTGNDSQVSFELFGAKDPTGTGGAGHKEYFKNLEDGMFYSAYPFEMTSRIGNNDALAVWLAGGGTGSLLSEGNLWVIIVIVMLVLGGVAALLIVKKKKTALADGAEKEDEE